MCPTKQYSAALYNAKLPQGLASMASLILKACVLVAGARKFHKLLFSAHGLRAEAQP